MFFRNQHLQYHARPERPDPLYAKKLQEVLGGQWGEMSVMVSYLFQGWNCRGPEKYRDLLLDTGTEEIAHVEMLSTMIARLLEGASVEAQESMVNGNAAVGAVMGGTRVEDAIMNVMNPQHAIVSGFGATPTDSMGFPFNARYTIASGNLLADFRYNVAAESQGRLQVCRLYNMTTDAGVKDMLSFMIARDTMHQNQWLAAIAELEEDGLEETPVPSNFPANLQKNEVAYQFWNCSEGEASAEGRWANGPSVDGKGEFEYVAQPRPLSDDAGLLNPVDPRGYGTPIMPVAPDANASRADVDDGLHGDQLGRTDGSDGAGGTTVV